MIEASSAQSALPFHWGRFLHQSLLTFAIVFAAVYGSVLLTHENFAIAPFWPANALLLVLALRSPWPPVWRIDVLAAASAASVLANSVGGASLALSIWFTLANGAEIVTAFLLIRYVRNAWVIDARPVFQRLRLLLVTALCASLISAIIAASGLVVLTHAHFVESFTHWFVCALLNLLLILPLGIMDYRDSLNRMKTARGLRSAAFLLGVVAATTVVLFSQDVSPFTFSITIAILLTTYFHRSLGAAAALILVTMIAVPLTAAGHGPLSLFIEHGAKGSQFLLQAFLIANCLVAVIATAVLDDRDGLRLIAERRQAEAQEKEKAKTELLRHVAHEIRTPLNVIQGLGTILYERGDLAPDAQKMMTAIIESTVDIQKLANDILDRSRVERGALHLEPISFPASLLFDELRNEFGATNRMARLIFDMSRQDTIWADRLRTKQMLRNLIANAIKYAALYGPIRIMSHPAKIAGFTCLEVIDQGPGVPKNRLHEAFEPFSKLGPASASDKSAGVGLSLVKQLAEAQLGAVGASSIPFVETRFWVLLPSEPSKDGLSAYASDAVEIDPRSVFPD